MASPCVFVLLLTIFCDVRFTESLGRFGHVTGDFNSANLLTANNTELNYALGSAELEKWYAFNVNSRVRTGSACFHGSHCLRIYNRPNDSQNRWAIYRTSANTFQPGKKYMFNIFIKFVATQPKQPVTIDLVSKSRFATPANGQYVNVIFHETTILLRDGRWKLLSMVYDMTTVVGYYTWIEFFPRIPNGFDYWLDAASLTEISYPNWEAEAQQFIQVNRMGSLNINLNIDPLKSLSSVMVDVKQTKRSFPFGVAVNESVLAGGDLTAKQRYLDWVIKRFTHGVHINGDKWQSMEWSGPKGDSKFLKVDESLQLLTTNGIVMRGHCIHWNNAQFTPAWVPLSANISAEITRRTDYMATHFKGKYIHWDVCNEFTNNRDYQEWTGNEDILIDIHKHVRLLDPGVKLAVNDWGLLQDPYNFNEYVDEIRELIRHGLVDVVGIQSHFDSTGRSIDMNVIKRRLEILGSLGVPLWITELTITQPDPVVRGAELRKVLKLYYGTQAVKGIIMWNPAPNPADHLYNSALMSWDTYETNEAGAALDQQLAEWTTTHLGLVPPSYQYSYNLPAFHGDYNIEVKYAGVVMETAQATVAPSSTTNIVINL